MFILDGYHRALFRSCVVAFQAGFCQRHGHLSLVKELQNPERPLAIGGSHIAVRVLFFKRGCFLNVFSSDFALQPAELLKSAICSSQLGPKVTSF